MHLISPTLTNTHTHESHMHLISPTLTNTHTPPHITKHPHH
ncbi:hypothetical protein LINPERPRIM_LOCUS3 [Linum perenne]